MRQAIIFAVILLFSMFMLPGAAGRSEGELPSKTNENETGNSFAAAAQENKTALISLDFEDADIDEVIKVIAMASGMNIVIGQDVKAKVTISLKDVHWERALDVILRTYNFTYKKEGNLIRIMTFEKLKQEERDIPLATKIVYLNFAEVSDLQTTLAKMISERGSIEVNSRTNSLLVTDIPAKVEEIEQIAKKLDTSTPQVLIEAMLVDIKLTKDDELGINWKIISAANKTDPTQSGITDQDYIQVPSALQIANSAIKIGWTQRLGWYEIQGLIQNWVEDKKANILASPKIVTLDNKTAKIEIKSQVAYTQVTSSDQGGSTTSTQFKDVTTGLEVTPHITNEGFVSMNIKPKQEFIEGTVGGEPAIGSRSAETNVLVRDGETIVIGGLRKVEDNATITKVPILGDIPLLGNFFRRKDLQKINTELVMFVTPYIIAHPKLSEEDAYRYKMLDGAREDFLKQQEKEKQKRLKKAKKQARLPKPEITAETSLPEPEISAEAKPAVPLSAVKEEKLYQELEENKEYIYSW